MCTDKKGCKDTCKPLTLFICSSITIVCFYLSSFDVVDTTKSNLINFVETQKRSPLIA